MDANTIEELNKVRKAMGLKPLPVPNAAPAPPPEVKDGDEEPASTIETREAAAGDNYRKVLEAAKNKKEREERLAKIKKEREKAQRFAALKGKGLGDLDDEEEAGDAKSWLKGMKKKQKKIDEARLKEAEAEAAAKAAAKEYSSKDLAGVKVGHDMTTLLDGDDQILTLKDNTVLDDDEEGDELENLHLREQEKLNENLNLKKKRPVYDPNDMDDTGERSILAQYDDEINGKKKKVFTLDTSGAIGDLSDILEAPAERQKKTLQSLDIDVMQDAPAASDYLDPSEIKVKKPKKKKKSKSTRQRDDEDALFTADQMPVADDAMDIDLPVAKKRKVVDDTFVDDDDLQTSLALQRRQALKKQKRMRPEDLAKQLKAEAEQEAEDGDGGDEQGGLVVDETTEFLSAINKPDLEEDVRPRKKSKSREPVTAMDAEDSDEDMENAPQIKEESAERNLSEQPEDLTTTGVDEEKYVAQGIGATLALLKERNIIDADANGAEKNEHFRQRELFLAEQARLIAQIDEDAKRQRERDRASGFLDRLSARDREEYARKQNADREFKLSNVRVNLLKKHKFNVELKYVDEMGRHLNQKEAFKELSHQFHGKTSGKGKTDKKLSKIEQENRRMAHSIFDASQDTGMSSATAQQTKKRKEAGVRLA